MHTAFEIKKGMLTVEVNGQPCSPEDFMNWDRRDRLGVLIDRPVGALGAGLLILLVAQLFYDFPGARRRSKPLYPEIYLFHLGGPWGSFINFDFWPDHKEIFLPPDPREALRAINNRGITHLAVPDGAPTLVEHRFKEEDAARDRLKECYVYGPTGTVENPDFVIRAKSEKIVSNYYGVLDLDHLLASEDEAGNASVPLQLQPKSDDELRLTFEAVNARLREIHKDAPDHLVARKRIDAATASGEIVEKFRKVHPDLVFRMLGKKISSSG